MFLNWFHQLHNRNTISIPFVTQFHDPFKLPKMLHSFVPYGISLNLKVCVPEIEFMGEKISRRGHLCLTNSRRENFWEIPEILVWEILCPKRRSQLFLCDLDREIYELTIAHQCNFNITRTNYNHQDQLQSPGQITTTILY